MTSRIKGPDGPRKVGPLDGVEPNAPVDQVRGTEATAPAAGAAKVAPADAVARVAAQLRAGEIDVDRAVELLIEHTVGTVSGGGANTQTADQLRAVLREVSRNDPHLTARIRKLTRLK
jgi:hypothetical protein